MRRSTAAVLVLAVAAAAQDPSAQDKAMDYGPCMMTTLECRGLAGTADKALVVRLDERAAVAFDTELLRMAAVWTDGWMRLRGTAYDGAHGPMPQLRGHKVAETRPLPGWAAGADFVDPRPISHGPLPRAHGQYRGHWLTSGGVVFGYRIGDMDVREMWALGKDGQTIERHLELGPTATAQRLLVADADAGARAGKAEGAAGGARLVLLQWTPQSGGLVELAASTTGFDRLPMGGPAKGDFLDPASGSGALLTTVPGFAPLHDGKDATKVLARLADGDGGKTADDWNGSVWFDKHKVDGKDSDDGRFLVDLQQAVDVSRISTFTWHAGYRAVQEYDLFASAEATCPDPAAADPETKGWRKLASVDSSELGQGDRHGVSIHDRNGLGRCRHLLFVVKSGSAFFREIDVFAGDRRAAVDATGAARQNLAASVIGHASGELLAAGNRIELRLPAHDRARRFVLRLASGDDAALAKAMPGLVAAGEPPLMPKDAGKALWGAAEVTKGQRGDDGGPFAVDTITIPFDNRCNSRMRTGAFDFLPDGRAAVSTWNGDVWLVSGIDGDLDRLEWRRFATGLFDPLGLRVVDGVIHVHGRDGITRLHDENDDGEADFYECFNNQVYITPAFHEFAFDLQTDADGNFYFSKGAPVKSGGRGFMKIVPHHGTILKLSKDGSSLTTVATGLRAPNGIGVSPTGVITSGDNEGTYMPRCRLNWITKPDYYAGVAPTAHRQPVPEQPDLPLCWLPMEVDNSGGGQVWVTGKAWGDLDGRLLHLSYGTCSAYLVLPDEVDGAMQGGVVRLPAEFSSSCMRGRFGPDGQLYVVGLQGWQTSAAREGGFHRVRRTEAPLGLPIALRTGEGAAYLTFAEPLDPETAKDAESYSVQIWNYLYSPNYGSPELSVLQPERKVEQGKENRDSLAVTGATLSADGRTVRIAIDGLRPVHQIKITWDVDSAAGGGLKGSYHGSIHRLRKDPGFPK